MERGENGPTSGRWFGRQPLPEGFREVRAGRLLIWVRESLSFLFDRGGSWRTEPGDSPAKPALIGRGRMLRVSLGSHERSWGILRHYRRGGLVRHLLRDFYLGSGRFFREVRVSEWARRHGVSTPEVLALRVERKPWGLFQADLLTREVENALDLLACSRLAQGGNPGPGSLDRRDVIRTVAFLVRSMHGAGVYHPDLNLKNLLLQAAPGGVRGFVIDLDRAYVRQPLPERRRINNLTRLYRSAEKLGCLGSDITLRDCLRFIQLYCGEDRGLAGRLIGLLRRGTFSARMHRLFWRLGTRWRERGRLPGST